MIFIKRLKTIGVAVTGVFMSLHAQDLMRDPADLKLVAYGLSAAQEATILSPSDSPSAFWELIDTAQYDFVHLNGIDNAVDESQDDQGYVMGTLDFESIEDATINVKAVYGEKGIYLYIWAFDDEWVSTAIGPHDHETWRNDGLEIWWDENPSAQGGHIWEKWLTYGSHQLQFWVNEPDKFLFNYHYFVPDGTNSENEKELDGEPDISYNLRADYSHFENMVGSGAFINRYMDGQTKRAEIHIPWEAVGKQSKPSEGTMFGFFVGRTDHDSNSGINEQHGGQIKWDQMSWNNGGHPWSNYEKVDSPWGDIYLGPALNH